MVGIKKSVLFRVSYGSTEKHGFSEEKDFGL
jgi:hypothetical protein